MNKSSRSRLEAFRGVRGASSPVLGWGGVVLLVAIGAGIVWVLQSSTGSWVATVAMVAGFIALFGFFGVRHSRWVESLVASRPGESICQFARAFSCRSVDTLLIRAVYESVQRQVGDDRLPIRASDRFLADLRLDSEEVDEIYWDVADTCGYLTEGGEQNPFFGRVETVADLVCFMHYQPHIK
jgi:hypothetical protein